MTEIVERYQRRAAVFDRIVSAVAEEQWSNASPCAEWTARDVVGHIIDMHAVVLRPLDRSLSPAPALGDDPVGAWRSARADIEAALADPDLAATECETPTGPMTVEQHIDAVPSADLVIHGWDVARATNQDDTIDPDELAAMWPEVQQIPEEMRIPEYFGPGIVVFGPAVDVPADANLQDRVLGLLGRDPNWGR